MMDYTIFGESHGPAVGVLLRDVPPGLPVDEEFICRQLLRRAPQDPLSTARHEPDQVEVLSGVYQGVTCGTGTFARRITMPCATRPGPVTPTTPLGCRAVGATIPVEAGPFPGG